MRILDPQMEGSASSQPGRRKSAICCEESDGVDPWLCLDLLPKW
jgi:hypothetical protein